MAIFAENINNVKYYDPRYDTTFKKVFSHPELLISFLNALLPLKDDEQIEGIEYLSPEMVPKTPDGKFSIVDVCCKDKEGRQFIVEMQMVWSEEFRSRVLFNASKAYVQQLGKGEVYKLLKLRFLTEINADTETAPAELVEDPLVGKAISLVEESAMTKEELYLYEKSLDNVRVE